jgi:hypothetical protein
MLTEVLGARVEAAPTGFEIADPVMERLLPIARGRLVADSTRAILSVEDVATFAIESGSEIRVDAEPGASESEVSVWLHGTVAALVLAQRGTFALHASVVAVDGAGVALTGPSRIGKSTTAMRLASRGHPLVSDDVSPLDGGDPITVHPFARPVHVFPHDAAELGLDVSEAAPVAPRSPKVALQAPESGPVPLRAVVVLRTGETDAPVTSSRVRGAEAHWLLIENVYRVALLRAIWEPQIFAWAGTVAARTSVHTLTRPPAAATGEDVAREVERIARDALQT